MRPQPTEQVLESILNACQTRILATPDMCPCGSLHDHAPGVSRGHFHLIGAQQCVLTGPTLREQVHLLSGDLVIFMDRARHELAGISRNCDEPATDAGEPTLYGEFEFPLASARSLLNVMPNYLVVRAVDASSCFRELSEVLVAAKYDTRPGQQIVINRLASSLVAIAMCEYAYTQAPEEMLAMPMDPRIARVLRAIHDRPGEDWGIRSLAAVAGMSRSTFALHFATVVGVPPMRYVTSWRVARAKEFLRDQRVSVAQVADRLGYSSEAAFRKLFKRVEGVGPGRIRAAALSDALRAVKQRYAEKAAEDSAL